MKGGAIAVNTRRWAVQIASNNVCNRGARLIGMKTSDRAAVHGTRPPIPDIVDKEKVEMDIQKAKEEKAKKRVEIENAADSQLKEQN